MPLPRRERDSPVTLMNGSPFLFLASLTASRTVVVDDSKSAGSISSDKELFFLRHSVRTETPFSVMVLGYRMQAYPPEYMKPLQMFS